MVAGGSTRAGGRAGVERETAGRLWQDETGGGGRMRREAVAG